MGSEVPPTRDQRASVWEGDRWTRSIVRPWSFLGVGCWAGGWLTESPRGVVIVVVLIGSR